jgi:protein-disulfide isomerase
MAGDAVMPAESRTGSGRPGRGSGVRAVALVLALGALPASEVTAQQPRYTRETLLAAAQRAPGAAKGLDSAPITIVEFSDFQCSYCRKFSRETLPRLEAEYIAAGKVRLVYRHLVVLGPASQRAAEAAECAGEQGRFWAFHDALFEGAGRLPAVEHLPGMGLDVAAFETCLRSGRHRERIARDTAMATAAGATGTPTCLVYDKLLIGAHPFDVFDRILQALGTGDAGRPPPRGGAPGPASSNPP